MAQRFVWEMGLEFLGRTIIEPSRFQGVHDLSADLEGTDQQSEGFKGICFICRIVAFVAWS